MIVGMTDAACLRPYSVYLKFADGTEGVIDLDAVVEWGGVFAPLKEIGFFSQMRYEPELGSICWPNGADLSPVVLYDKIKNAEAMPAQY